MIVGQSAERSLTTRATPLIPHPNLAAYFIRLALQPQQPPLGIYQAHQFQPSESGLIVADAWVRSATNRKGVELDQWLLTPRELWGIVLLQPSAVALTQPPFGFSHTVQKPWLLSSFIASFKATAAKRIHLQCNQLGQPVWQCGYQEQCLQDAAALAHIRDHLSTVQGSPHG